MENEGRCKTFTVHCYFPSSNGLSLKREVTEADIWNLKYQGKIFSFEDKRIRFIAAEEYLQKQVPDGTKQVKKDI
jgi:hypothetical protein